MTLELKLKKALDSNEEKIIHVVFQEIYEKYSKLICFVILKKINNLQDAEELTQDVFVQFFNSLDRSSIKNIKYYLVRTANNLTINFIKSNEKALKYNDSLNTNNEFRGNSEIYERILQDMKRCISEYEVEIVIKHVVEDFTFKELAEFYHKPIKTIFSTYKRAINKIKKGVNKND